MPIYISLFVSGGVFIVIFVGIGLACITLAFEYWWYKYRKPPAVEDLDYQVIKQGDLQRTKRKDTLDIKAFAEYPVIRSRHGFQGYQR